MKSTSESLSHSETSSGRAAGGNCVVVRWGGEQSEADLRSEAGERIADGKVLGITSIFFGYRFYRSRRGRLCKLARPKSLMKMRESIKSKSRRNNGKSMEAMTADLNRTLKGWFEYFKHIHASQLGEIEQWLRMRLRSILRKRRGATGRG